MQEPQSPLDERERDTRSRASFQVHCVLSSIVLAGVLYRMLTSDMAANGKLHLWHPTDGSHGNAIFGALILLSLTLPGAVLAFGKVPSDAH